MMRAGSVTAAILWCLLLVAGGCGTRRDPLLAISGPKDVLRFELRDGEGHTVWAIEAQQGRTLRSLHYGEVPTGFRQLEPAGGQPPRPLIDGEPLVAETITRARIFVHQGFALGASSFRAHDSWMQRIAPQAAENP